LVDTPGGPSKWHRVRAEMVDYWANVLYLALFFGFIANYRRLILAHYGVDYTAYGVEFFKAVVLAKIILVADKGLHLGRGYEDRPLAIPTLYKAILFTLVVECLAVLELLGRNMFHGSSLEASIHVVAGSFTSIWLAHVMVVFAAFVPFFAFRELERVLGKGRIVQLFFRGESGTRLSE